MTSTFSGLSTALSALYAQRRGLDVTGQNIANANTDGYSRQRVNLESVGGPTEPALFSVWNGAGAGVTVSDVERIRDAFLEERGRTEHATASYLSTQKGMLGRIEQIFGEPGDHGLAAQLADMWAGFDDVANAPGDLAARSQLLERAGTVVDTLRDAHGTLASLWTSGREQLDALVTEVNTTAATVADLNGAIQRATQAGMPANELADRRDQLVLHLAELTGAKARSGEDGVVDVSLGGRGLVTGTTANVLQTAGANRLDDATGNPVGLTWARDGYPVTAPSGEAAAFVEALSTTIPGYSDGLDAVAATLATTVNIAHKAGYDLSGAPGGDFFSGSTAADIALAITEPEQLAASGVAGGNLDGGNADRLARLADSAGGVDRQYRQYVVQLGVDVQTVNRRTEIQDSITADVDAARQSQSGVSLDEEMTNMLMFQRAYEGASRVLTAIDSMLDTLINRTGLVGR